MDYEEGDDDVLDGEEEVLAIGGEGEVVAVGVGKSDCIRERFEDVCGEGKATRGACRHDCAADVGYMISRGRRVHALRSNCGTFMMEPPTTIPSPSPFESEYLRHSMSPKSRFSTMEV